MGEYWTKVLITSATSLLGGHLLRALQQRGEQMRVLILPVENAQKLVAQGVEVMRGDVTDASTLPIPRLFSYRRDLFPRAF